MDFLQKLSAYSKQGKLQGKIVPLIRNFYLSYKEAIEKNRSDVSLYLPLFSRFLDLIVEEIANPFVFEAFHQAIRKPFDYYQFGLDFIRPLILWKDSKAFHLEQADRIVAQLQAKENVILFANHQTEPDPQVISLLLEKTHPQLAEEMIFVAGHRVVTDPLAIPFSKGRNLLCIFSKKYIETDLALKPTKLLHNQRTMKKMGQLLSEGGKCIYVAPSGGRDRIDASGQVDVSRFDPQSVEMFWLMAQKANRVTRFYSLALSTYRLLPPPQSVQKELGEARYASCAPARLAFGPEIDMDLFSGSESLDKRSKRTARADFIWNQTRQAYLSLL